MSDNENQFLFNIDKRVDIIGERIATLEGKLAQDKPKSFRQLFSEYGGVLGLILSLIIGTFTVYDKVFMQPQKDAVAKLDSFRRDVDTLVQISLKIASIDFTNPTAQAQINSLAPQRIALIEKIELYGEEYPENLKFSDRLLLASENEIFMRYSNALVHANLALGIATDTGHTANAYWAIARLHGKLKKFSEMRNYYESSINELLAIGLSTNAATVMQLYIDWIYNEIALSGDCIEAEKVLEAMRAIYSRSEVWPVTKEHTHKMFGAMLSGSPNKCGFTSI